MIDEDKSKDEFLNELISLRKRTTKIENILSEAETMVKMGCWEWDIENDEFLLSEGWQLIHGVEKSILSLDELLPIAHPDDLPAIKKAFQESLDTSKPYEIEHRIIRQDNGEVRYIKAHGKIVNVSGKPVKIYGAAQDITESKQLSNRIQKKMEIQKALLSSMPAFVFLKDSKLNYITANDAFSEMVGLSVDEIKNKTDFDIFPAEYAENFRSYDLAVINTGEPIHNLEENYITRDGKSRWALTSKVPYFDGKGRVIGLVGTALDITNKKQLVEKLEKSESEKSLILDSVSDVLVYQDINYKIMWCNRKAGDAFNESIVNLTGKYCYEVWHGRQTPCENCPVRESIKTGMHQEVIITAPDGRIWHVRADPIKNIDSKITGVIQLGNEITEKVKAEEKMKVYARELEKANIELETRVLEQTEQIKNAERTRELELHHRIKNNLQVISSLLSLQSGKFEDEKVIEAFKDTQNRVSSISIVHQKLYQSKDLENINLEDYIKDLVDHLTTLYGGNNINVNIDVQDLHFGIDIIIPLGMLINEIMSNSLKYAFPYNESSEITIKLNQNDKGFYTLVVADNGKGIPEDIDVRASDSLGLQLINSLVEQINGCFELDKDNGTKFIIEFII